MTKHETTAEKRAKKLRKATGRPHHEMKDLVGRQAPSFGQLIRTAANPTSQRVAFLGRVLVALTLGGHVDGRCVVVEDKDSGTRTVWAVVVRHKRLRPDDDFHDALRNAMDQGWDGVVFVLFGDGEVLTAQCLDRQEVAAYELADLPRRHRLGFNEGSFVREDGSEYGIDQRRELRPYLNYPAPV